MLAMVKKFIESFFLRTLTLTMKKLQIFRMKNQIQIFPSPQAPSSQDLLEQSDHGGKQSNPSKCMLQGLTEMNIFKIGDFYGFISLKSRNCREFKTSGVYRMSIFKIRPNILIGLQKLQLRPKDLSRIRLFIYWNLLRLFSRLFSFVLPYKVCPLLT